MIVVILLRGATAFGCAVAALFFARFWKTTTDRLFLWFSLAFGILALDYAALGLIPQANEWGVPIFAVRLAAFCLILYAIADKNRTR